MDFSPPRLHPKLITRDEQKDRVRQQMQARALRRRAAASHRVADADENVAISLTTVSEQGSFDAWLDVEFPAAAGTVTASLLVDSGNTMMIIPNGEDLVGVAAYTILGTATEPWGCPANVVRGPVQIATRDGGTYSIQDCVFYACTGPNPAGERTANFGAGRVVPWSANPWNTPAGLGVTLQSPLSYDAWHPYAEFSYAPAEAMFSHTGELFMDDSSLLILHSSPPAGFTLLDLNPQLEWMAVVPQSLTIGRQLTGWPGSVPSPIAVIDTGGGPVFLSDPTGYVYDKTWPHAVACPSWTSGSRSCVCVSERLTVGLTDLGGSPAYSYTIDTSSMPASVRGLTAVLCQESEFLMGKQGMNAGGITALFNRLLVCYQGTQVGLAPGRRA